MHRFSRLLAVLLLSVASIGLTVPVAAGSEEGFVAAINADRTAHGMNALAVYWDLTDDARDHSRLMADTNDLHHNPNLGSVTTGWHSLGENVGVGPNVEILHRAFMDSPGHRANVLGDYNYVGVGVVQVSDTKMWVTVVFMKGPEGLAEIADVPVPSEPAPPPTDPPADEPPIDSAPNARRPRPAINEPAPGADAPGEQSSSRPVRARSAAQGSDQGTTVVHRSFSHRPL